VRAQNLIILLLLLISCATTDSGGGASADKEFAWIENSDFNQESAIRFNPREDEFPTEIANIDSLSKESLARLPEPKLETVIDGGDVISQVAGLCYQRRFNDSLSVFRKNYEKYNLNPSFWNQMGTCHLLQGNYRKALLFYNKSRDLKKDYAPPVNNIGVLYLK